MNMKDARVQIMIPAFNDVDKLDVTMQSIKNQDYNQENIFVIIVDFGSEDGTYEKMLTYDRERLGIYRCVKTKNRRQMIAEIAKIGGYTHPGGCFSFQAVLYPGEILYPNCLSLCVNAFIDHISYKPSMVICEADIAAGTGEKAISQVPLFSDNRLIDGKHEMSQYVSREFKHEVFCMGYGFSGQRYRAAGECNEQRWWNKCARANNEQNVVYIKEPVAALNIIRYQDELEEILLRWESLIVQVRIFESKFGRSFDDKFEQLGRKNLAKYAIWRSYLLYKDGKSKEAEDCLLISGVVDSDIVKENIYNYMQQLVCEGLDCHEEDIRIYFDQAL